MNVDVGIGGEKVTEQGKEEIKQEKYGKLLIIHSYLVIANRQM